MRQNSLSESIGLNHGHISIAPLRSCFPEKCIIT